MNACRSGLIRKATWLKLVFASALIGLIATSFFTEFVFADFGLLFKRKRVVVYETKKTPVARSLSKDGALVRQPAGSTTWKTVAHEEELFEGDVILSGAGSSIENIDKSVRLTFWGDVAGTSPLPIRESAIKLLPPKAGVDFNINFERGRIELINTKEKGSALCHIILLDGQDNGSVQLNEPGASCALEGLGRWLKGTHFNPNKKESVDPGFDLIYIATKGTSEVFDHDSTHFMSAPPGPAMLQWHSAGGLIPVKSKLEKLPGWVLPPDLTNPLILSRLMAGKKLKDQFFAGKDLGELLCSMAKSSDKEERFIAINLTLALDQLEIFYKIIAETKYHDVLDNGIISLRHWIGRKAGQDLKLYEFMLTGRHYSKNQAAIFIDLLHSFGDDELKEPETFEALIDYLSNEKIGIRALSHWHLHRLVPKGRDLKFNPTGPEAEREAIVEKWKKLVPKGTVPSRSID